MCFRSEGPDALQFSSSQFFRDTQHSIGFIHTDHTSVRPKLKQTFLRVFGAAAFVKTKKEK
jgi:hypothetical protein